MYLAAVVIPELPNLHKASELGKKLEPVNVIRVPPDSGPLDGEIDDTLGPTMYEYSTLSELK